MVTSAPRSVRGEHSEQSQPGMTASIRSNAGCDPPGNGA